MKNVAFVAILLFGGCWVKGDPLITPQAFNSCRVGDLDVNLASGKYLDFYLNADSNLLMSWGSNTNGKIGVREYGKWPVPLGLPCYQCEFENYIAIRHSCGSSCWSLTLLPTRKEDSIVVLQEDLCIDTNRGYIFARRCCTEENEFCLYNVNKGSHTPINLPGYEWPGDITIALDSFAFVEEGLFVKWDSWKEEGGGIGRRDTLITLK